MTRSDGGHLKQGASLCTIILIYLLVYNVIYFLTKKLTLIEKNNLLGYLNIIIFLVFVISNLPENFLKTFLLIKKGC